MFHTLTSLQTLLIGWASSDAGRQRISALPRDNAFASEILRIKEAGKRLTGEEPNSDQISQVVIAFLS